VLSNAAIIAITTGRRNKGIHYEIAGLNVGNTLTDFFHIAGCFVPCDCW
jgi:hypothetical protein